MPGPLQLRHWPWLVATVTVLLFAAVWVTTPLVVARNFQGRLDGGDFDRMDEMLPPEGRWLVLVLKPGEFRGQRWIGCVAGAASGNIKSIARMSGCRSSGEQ